MSAPSSGSGQCRVCRGLALYEPVANGPWWTHDDKTADHRVVIDPDTASYGPDGIHLPGYVPGNTESTSAALARVTAERDEALAEVTKLAQRARKLKDELLVRVVQVAEVVKERDEAAGLADQRGRELVRIDEAAGRDIAKPDEPLVDRVADLRRGRAERDEMREASEQWCQRYADMKDERDEALAQLDKPCGACHPCVNYGALKDAEATAAELEQLRAALPRVVTVTPLAPPPPLAQRDCWICTTCGTESDLAGSDEHGALTPVTVTVTIRTEEHP